MHRLVGVNGQHCMLLQSLGYLPPRPTDCPEMTRGAHPSLGRRPVSGPAVTGWAHESWGRASRHA